MDKSIIEKLKELEAETDGECTCDTEYPWHKCERCEIASHLNDAYWEIDTAYKKFIES